VVVGPGLGCSADAQHCLELLREARQPMVIDAGALDAAFLQSMTSTGSQRVITPHPGEAAALLSCSTAQIQANRMLSAQRLVETFAMTTVLKGSGTLVTGTDVLIPAINTRGNPGMATAGMGDVLCGVIAAFLGQGLDAFSAARSAVYVHALCAESYAEGRDESGLIASDIIGLIPQMVKQLRDAE
jgi:NAD(P)H-hydrate epimerase